MSAWGWLILLALSLGVLVGCLMIAAVRVGIALWVLWLARRRR